MSSSLFLHLAKSPFQSLTHIQYSVYTNAKPRKRKLLQALPALDYYMCLQEFLQSPGGLTPPLSLSLIFVSSMQLCPWCNYALLLSFVMWTHANLCECDYARFIELDLIRIFTSINYTFIVSSFMLDKIWMYWIECIITKHSNHLSSVPDGLNNMHVDRLSIILYNSFFPFLYQ
jgi:hypothetical protein